MDSFSIDHNRDIIYLLRDAMLADIYMSSITNISAMFLDMTEGILVIFYMTRNTYIKNIEES